MGSVISWNFFRRKLTLLNTRSSQFLYSIVQSCIAICVHYIFQNMQLFRIFLQQHTSIEKKRVYARRNEICCWQNEPIFCLSLLKKKTRQGLLTYSWSKQYCKILDIQVIIFKLGLNPSQRYDKTNLQAMLIALSQYLNLNGPYDVLHGKRLVFGQFCFRITFIIREIQIAFI